VYSKFRIVGLVLYVIYCIHCKDIGVDIHNQVVAVFPVLFSVSDCEMKLQA